MGKEKGNPLMPPLKDLGDFAKGGCVLVMLKFSLVTALIISIANMKGQ